MTSTTHTGGGPAPRTFVISDCHGHPELICAPLEHGGFDPQRDRLIFAGDAVDRGPHVEVCLDLIETYADEVLVGNHDQAIALGYWIPEQDACNAEFRDRLLSETLIRTPDEAVRVCTCVEDVLVTHGGVCEVFDPTLAHECHGDPAALADHLNRRYREAFEEQRNTGRQSDDLVMSRLGPARYRPKPRGRDPRPLDGVRQVVGHTPPFAGAPPGLHMIDPVGGYLRPSTFRYALIEDGCVDVVEGPIPY